MEGLTPRQEKFCIEYAKCGNSRQAYINAGYKRAKDNTLDTSACRLLKNEKVQKRLHELYEKAKNDNIADVQEMQETLTKIIRQGMEEEVIVVEGCGDGVSEAVTKKKTSSIKDIVSAINTLAKMQGAFVDKVSVEGVVPVVISGGESLED